MYCTAGQATDGNMAHAHYVLDSYDQRYKLRICNTYCFSTATIFARTRLNITSYIYRLSCVLNCWSQGLLLTETEENENSPSHPVINPLNPELNPICYLLTLLAHHFLHVSRIRVKLLTLRLLMSYMYMEHLFLMFLDYTQRRSTVGRTPLDE